MTLLAHLCDMDDELQLWVLRWLAYPLRNPGAKMSTALVFNGGEGSGKSLFLNFVVAELYGDVAARVRPRDLHSVFNGWIEGVSLAVVDGEFARSHVARMKEAMTAESFVIGRKGQLAKRIPNRLNFIYVTSSPDFLPADVGNRRFTVIEVPPARQRPFYQAVLHEIAEGGADAFRDYLMHGLDMGTFNESTLPPASVRQGDTRETA
jgi:predicted P-loop ATPase